MMDTNKLSFASYLLRNSPYVRDDTVWKEPNPWYYVKNENDTQRVGDMTPLERTCLTSLNTYSYEGRYQYMNRVIPAIRSVSQSKQLWELAERLIPYAYSRNIASWIMVERQRYHNVSSFALFLDGLYICDTLQPSLHADTKSWSVGGRGGLPAGMYTLKSYWWIDKQKPVWQLTGDYRRGSILLHSGNSVTDSKGCILLGVLNSDESAQLTSSQVVTSAVWTIMRRLKPRNSIINPRPCGATRFIILRSNVYSSE